MYSFISHSTKQTEEFAQNKIAPLLKPGDVLAFFGGMGMGKTAFVRGLAKGLGITDSVSSPTFAIVNEYRGNPPLAHFDMYRIGSWDDLYTTGFFEYLDSGCILAVEWSENIENALPEGTIFITMEKLDEDSRRICIKGDDRF